MSSSKKKMARKATSTNNKQSAAVAEAKKLKRYTITFWVVIALVMALFVSALGIEAIGGVQDAVYNVTWKHDKAVTVGDHTLTSAELNYYYVDSIYNYFSLLYSYYGSYYYYFLPFSTTEDLADQVYDKETGKTWSDYFLDSAVSTIKSTYALYDLAMKNDHKLTDDEQASLDSSIESITTATKEGEYNSVSAYLRETYGNGASKKSYINYLTVSAYASSYYSYYSDSLEFSDDQKTEFVGNKVFNYNSYNYSYYRIDVEDFLPEQQKDADGNKIDYTDGQKLAAVQIARMYAETLGNKTYATVEDFLAAVKELDKQINPSDDETATSSESGDETTSDDKDETKDEETKDDESKDEEEEEENPENYVEIEDKLFSSNNSLFQDWLSGKVENPDYVESEDKDDEDEEDDDKYLYEGRKEGDMIVISNIDNTEGAKESDTTYFYVLRFESTEKNEFVMKDVRHILISCTGKEQDDGSIKFTDTTAAKTAKETAEKILKEYKENPTEENFEALSKKYLEDSTAKEAALYENVYPGQMVSQFEDWCYDADRKAGDTDIVATTYGYHIMYFVGNTEQTYRDYMITEALRSDTVTEWAEALSEAIDFELKISKNVHSNLAG